MIDTERLWQLLSGTIALLIGLLGVLYHHIAGQIKEIQSQLNTGADEFSVAKVKFKALEKDLEALGLMVKSIDVDIRICEDVIETGDRTVTGIKNDLNMLSKEFGDLACECRDMALKQMQDHETILAIKIHHRHQHNEEIK